MNMFCMIADKLILNWAEKNSFFVDVSVCYQITMWLIFLLFLKSSLFKMSAEENIIIWVS